MLSLQAKKYILLYYWGPTNFFIFLTKRRINATTKTEPKWECVSDSGGGQRKELKLIALMPTVLIFRPTTGPPILRCSPKALTFISRKKKKRKENTNSFSTKLSLIFTSYNHSEAKQIFTQLQNVRRKAVSKLLRKRKGCQDKIIL